MCYKLSYVIWSMILLIGLSSCATIEPGDQQAQTLSEQQTEVAEEPTTEQTNQPSLDDLRGYLLPKYETMRRP